MQISFRMTGALNWLHRSNSELEFSSTDLFFPDILLARFSWNEAWTMNLSEKFLHKIFSSDFPLLTDQLEYEIVSQFAFATIFSAEEENY